ncbi:MAG: hypothetical protein JWM43_626 [Acidobacteriaceae bacterium]|nr:hypothetical protein [Acidobacteriaceae bacterium]
MWGHGARLRNGGITMDKKMQDAGKQKKNSPASKPAGGMQAKAHSAPDSTAKPMRMNKSELITK